MLGVTLSTKYFCRYCNTYLNPSKHILIFFSFFLKAEVRAQLDGEAKEDCVVAPPPLCDTGCTESMLGLRNIQPGEDIWELLKVKRLFLNGKKWMNGIFCFFLKFS